MMAFAAAKNLPVETLKETRIRRRKFFTSKSAADPAICGLRSASTNRVIIIISTLTILSTMGLYTLLSTPGGYKCSTKHMPPAFKNRNKLSSTNKSVFDLDFLSKHEATPQELANLNKNIKSVGEYADPKFLGDCPPPTNRKDLQEILHWWMEFAAEHNIFWWLVDGTLLGSHRHHGDIVPWDSDMDIGILRQDEELIRKLQTPRENISASQIQFVTRPGPFCPYNAPRTDCSGKTVNSQTDGCAFCGPLARVFRHSWRRLDLFVFAVELDKTGRMKLYSEGDSEYTRLKKRYPLELFFPLKKCQFLGLTVLCPRKPVAVLKDLYGDYDARYKCKNKKWVRLPKI